MDLVVFWGFLLFFGAACSFLFSCVFTVWLSVASLFGAGGFGCAWRLWRERMLVVQSQEWRIRGRFGYKSEKCLNTLTVQ